VNNTNYLSKLGLLIILVPFTSTSIYSFNSGFFITPAYFLLIFFSVIYVKKCQSIEYNLLILFLLILLSIFFSFISVIFNTDIYLESSLLNKLDYFVVYKKNHFTFFVYFIVGLFFSFLITKIYIKNIKLIIYQYLYACFIIGIIIVLQNIFIFTGFENFAYILNNNHTWTGHRQIFEGTDLIRLSGPGIEPSVIAKFYAPSLLLALVYLKKYLKLIFIVIYLFAMIKGYSSTFYLGFVLSVLFYLFYKKNNLMLLSLIPLTIPFIYKLLDKIDSGSFGERFLVFNNNMDIFIQSPFFGVGYGILPNNDALSFILGSGGLFGILCFSLLLFKPLFSINKNFTLEKYFIVIAIALQFSSGLDYGNLQLFLFFGILYTIYKKSSQEQLTYA
jgi:hypothetical protein